MLHISSALSLQNVANKWHFVQ